MGRVKVGVDAVKCNVLACQSEDELTNESLSKMRVGARKSNG